MAKSIMSHRVIRGSLLHQVQDVQFPQFKHALCAASAIHALKDLQEQGCRALRKAQHDARPRRTDANVAGAA